MECRIDTGNEPRYNDPKALSSGIVIFAFASIYIYVSVIRDYVTYLREFSEILSPAITHEKE